MADTPLLRSSETSATCRGHVPQAADLRLVRGLSAFTVDDADAFTKATVQHQAKLKLLEAAVDGFIRDQMTISIKGCNGVRVQVSVVRGTQIEELTRLHGSHSPFNMP